MDSEIIQKLKASNNPVNSHYPAGFAEAFLFEMKMLNVFVNEKYPGMQIVLDGKNKKELKQHLKKLLLANKLKLTGWEVKE